MSLNKQKKLFNFTAGIDNGDTDEYQNPFGSFLLLENVDNSRRGALKKRGGYIQLSNLRIGGTVSTGNQLFNLKDSLLLSTSDNLLYSYSDSYYAWSTKGSLVSMNTEITPIVNSGISQSNEVASVCNSLLISVYYDDNSYKILMKDLATGSFLVAPRAFLISASSFTNMKIVPRVIGGYRGFYIFLVDQDATLRLIQIMETETFASALPYVSLAETLVITSYDVQVRDATTVNLVYSVHSGSDDIVYLAKISSGTITSITATSFNFEGVVSFLYNKNQDYLDNPTAPVDFIIFLANNYLQYCRFSSTFVVVDELTSTDYVSSSNLITGYVDGDNVAHLVYSRYLSDMVPPATRISAIGSSSISHGTQYFGHAIYSRPFYNNGTYYFVALATLASQNAYLLVDSNNTALLRFSYQYAVATLGLTDAVYYNSSHYLLIRENVVSTDVSSMSLVELFADSSKPSIQLSSSLVFGGGGLSVFDGSTLHEVGFNQYPKIHSAAAIPGTDLAAGTYTYRVVYEWRDNNSQLYQSTPSAPVTVTVDGVNRKVELYISYLHNTRKENVRVCIYRNSVDSPLIFQRVLTYENSQKNNVLTPFWYTTDAVADISSNEILYTNGGIVDNINPSNAKLLATYKNRVFAVENRNSNKIWFSRVWTPTEAINFSDINMIQLVDDNTVITGLKQLDNNLLIFKETAVYYITGEGPEDNGNNSDYQYPVKISPSDVGCTNSNSIASVADGILFQSLKGFYFVGRDLAITYVGSPVSYYTDNFVILSNWSVSEVACFLTSSSRVLRFDADSKTWTVDTFNPDLLSGVSINNAVFLLTDEGLVLQRDTSSRLDIDLKIVSKITTNWISLSELNDYVRLYSIQILGKYLGAHTLIVDISYDFVDAVIDTFSIANTATTYGNLDYGDETPYGSLPLLQFACKVSRQKCTSFKLTIRDDYPTGVSTAGFSISAVSLEYGVKKGFNKISSSGNRLQS